MEITYGIADAKGEGFDLVEAYHYSGKAVKHARVCAAAYLSDVMVSACFFSMPAARWKEEVIELVRLVRFPGADDVSMTKLISVGAKECKIRGFDLLISYADTAEGHHGGVYQASSWKYAGVRGGGATEAFLINGERVHRRTCVHRWGTSSFPGLKALLPDASIVPVKDQGKHLYWRALNKIGDRKAARLNLQTRPYPKPAQP